MTRRRWWRRVPSAPARTEPTEPAEHLLGMHDDTCCIHDVGLCCCGGLTCLRCDHLREDHIRDDHPSGVCEVCGCRDFEPDLS